MPDRDATLDAFIAPEPDEDEESKAGEDGEESEARAESAEPTEAEEVEEAEGSTEDKGVEEAGEPIERDEGDVSETITDESAVTATDEAPGTNTDVPVTERAETTFSWSPAGGECAACGEQARRRWRTDAGYVCHGCVDWERAPER